MTPNPFASSFLSSGQGGRRKRPDLTPDLTLGVFSDGTGWKVYSQFDAADVYPSRQEAVVAAETRAFEAARAGRKVELFLEDEDGSLGQARLELQ